MDSEKKYAYIVMLLCYIFIAVDRKNIELGGIPNLYLGIQGRLLREFLNEVCVREKGGGKKVGKIIERYIA